MGSALTSSRKKLVVRFKTNKPDLVGSRRRLCYSGHPVPRQPELHSVLARSTLYSVPSAFPVVEVALPAKQDAKWNHEVPSERMWNTVNPRSFLKCHWSILRFPKTRLPLQKERHNQQFHSYHRFFFLRKSQIFTNHDVARRLFSASSAPRSTKRNASKRAQRHSKSVPIPIIAVRSQLSRTTTSQPQR